MSKIVITGYGVAVPGSMNSIQFEKQLQAGSHGITVIQDDLLTKNKLLSLGFIDTQVYSRKEKAYKRYPNISKAQITTAEEAVQMAGIDFTRKNIGVFIGTSLGGTEGYENSIALSSRGNYKVFPTFACGHTNYHSTASAISNHFNITGITKTVSTGCTAGLEALEDASLYIKAGQIDSAIVGGVDMANTASLIYAFSKIRTLPLGHHIEVSGLPFSKNSKGFVPAEGSATIVIEKEEDAIKRGATIYAEIVDTKSNNDGFGVFGSDLEGNRMYQLCREVVKDRTPDYVNSQALGLHANDIVESLTHERLFQNSIPITSIKSMVGHAFGASGLIQLVASIIGMEKNFIPFTTRTDKKGFEDLQIIDKLEKSETSEVLITSHGYGGNNAATYIRKY